jgi:hypothetical protein
VVGQECAERMIANGASHVRELEGATDQTLVVHAPSVFQRLLDGNSTVVAVSGRCPRRRHRCRENERRADAPLRMATDRMQVSSPPAAVPTRARYSLLEQHCYPIQSVVTDMRVHDVRIPIGAASRRAWAQRFSVPLQILWRSGQNRVGEGFFARAFTT